MPYPLPDNEDGRLVALDAYGVVGTPPEMDFDEIAEIAARIRDRPAAVINVVADRWRRCVSYRIRRSRNWSSAGTSPNWTRRERNSPGKSARPTSCYAAFCRETSRTN